jgi:hypothetical protein
MKSLIPLLGILVVSLGATVESVADEVSPIMVTAVLSKPIGAFPDHFERPMPPSTTAQPDNPSRSKTTKLAEAMATGRSVSFEERVEKVLRVMEPSRTRVRGSIVQVFFLSPPQTKATSAYYDPYSEKVYYEVRLEVSEASAVVFDAIEGVSYQIRGCKQKHPLDIKPFL